MPTLRESTVIDEVEHELKRNGVWFVNHHGTVMGRSGVPDILTLDHNGTLLAIEAKSPGEKPKINQFRRAVEILNSDGRYMIAYPNFNYSVVGARRTPGDGVTQFPVGTVIGDAEFDAEDAYRSKRTGVVEVVSATR